MIDYSLIVLTSEAQSAFDKFKNSNTANLTRREFNLLAEKGLLLEHMDGHSSYFNLPATGKCELSTKGEEFRIYQQGVKDRETTERKRFWITTLIAIGGVICGIIGWFMPF